MDIKDIDLKVVKYRIAKFDIIIPGYDEPYSVDDAHRGNFVIEKDFENFLFPYIEVRCMVPDHVYRDIINDSENVYVDFKVECGLFNEPTEMEPSTTLYNMGTVIDSRFYAFIDNRTPRITDASTGEKLKEEEPVSGEGRESAYAYDLGKTLVMGLYKADHIFKSNRVINNVLSGATTTDGLVWCLKELGIAQDVLMSPADNSKVYTQLLVPPLPGPKAIKRISNTYELHKAGTVVFFDYDTIYVLNKKLGCTAWYPNEYKTTYLTSYPVHGDQLIMKTGFYSNNREKYSVVNIVGNNLSLTNESMFQSELVGGNILAIDGNTGEIRTLTSSLKVSDLSPGKNQQINRVVVQNEGTAGIDRAKTAIEQSQNHLNIMVQDVNIRAFAPNKDFIFTTDNSRYKEYMGHYRITSFGAIFTKESTMYAVSVTASFVGGQETT